MKKVFRSLLRFALFPAMLLLFIYIQATAMKEAAGFAAMARGEVTPVQARTIFEREPRRSIHHDLGQPQDTILTYPVAYMAKANVSVRYP